MESFLQKRYAGICLAMGADFSYVSMDALVQMLEINHGIPAGQVLAYRQAMCAVLAAGILVVQGRQQEFRDAFSREGLLFWSYGFVNGLQILIFYGSLLYEPLSDTITIFHVRPLPVAILCSVFLGEAYRWHQGLACVVSFVGVLLIARPQFLFPNNHPVDMPGSTTHWLGVTLACIAMFLSGIGIFILRKIGKSASATLMLFIFSVACFIIGSVEMLATRTPLVSLSATAWGLLIFMTVFGTIASIAFNLALQREAGLFIALLAYLQIVHSVVIQWLMYGTTPDLLGSAGMGVIVIAGIFKYEHDDKAADHDDDDDDDVHPGLADDEEVDAARVVRPDGYGSVRQDWDR